MTDVPERWLPPPAEGGYRTRLTGLLPQSQIATPRSGSSFGPPHAFVAIAHRAVADQPAEDLPSTQERRPFDFICRALVDSCVDR